MLSTDPGHYVAEEEQSGGGDNHRAGDPKRRNSDVWVTSGHTDPGCTCPIGQDRRTDGHDSGAEHNIVIDVSLSVGPRSVGITDLHATARSRTEKPEAA